MAKTPKIPGGLPEVTEWSPEPPQPKFTPNQPEFHGNGRYGAPANPEMPTLRPAAPTAPAAPAGAQGGWFRRTVDAAKNPGQTLRAAVPTAEGAGRALGTATRVAGRLAPAAMAADAVSHANDYKINDPSVDSSASGTWNALRQGDFAGAGRSLSKGALETLMDVGSAGANVADLFVPGKAPVSTKYGNMLRQQFGDQLVDNTSTAPTKAAAAPVAAPPVDPRVQTGWGSRPGTPEIAAAPANPNGTILRSGNAYSGKDIKFGADIVNKNPLPLDGSFGVTSLDSTEGHRQNLLELQRNAAERANAPPMGGATGIGSRGTSMMDDLVAKHNASKQPDMVGLSPYDKAHMQATLRQSQEANANTRAIAGLNNETAQAGLANSANIAAMHDATQRRSNDQNNATSLRGQEMDYAGRMAPLQYQQARMQLAGKYMQAANGDPAKAQALAMSDGAHDVADHFSKNVEALQGQAGKADSLIENKRKEIATGIKGAFNHMDKEGQPKVSEALEQKAIARFMRTNPDFHKEGDPAKRQKMIDDALGDEEIMSRLEKPTEGGWGSVTPNIVSKPMLRQDNIPDAELLQGQMGAPIGALRNLLSPNTNKGDRFYDPGDGRTAVNMGDMSARALKRFQEHQEAAKNKLRPN